MTTPQGRYEFIETLGTGATSRVDKARDTLIGRTVALKTFLHGFGSGDLQKQFLREAQIIGRLAHPFIVSLYDVGTDPDGVPYFVMEYVEGKTLEEALESGPLPFERAVIWGADLAAALSRAHKGKIIHGDVKPANILVTQEGQVKLGDFGIARFATQVSGSGSLMGTPAYLSPEQILGHTQDTRSDLFSLGIILYQMATGVRPFNGTSVSAVCAQIVAIEPPPPSHHNPSLPPGFDHVVMRCLAKNPAERYATAEALGTSLYPFARNKDAAAAPAQVSWFSERLRGVSAFASDAVDTLVETAQSALERIPAAVSQNPWSAWWNRPMKSREIWVAATVTAMAISFVPFARAIRAHAHAPQSPVSTRTSSIATNLQTNRNVSLRAPITSEASVINVNLPAADSSDAKSSQAAPAPVNAKPAGGADSNKKAPGTSRHTVTKPKPQPAFVEAPMLLAELETAPGLSVPLSPPPVQKTSLHVDIVSGVLDQTVAVYAGDELLLSAPLKAAHRGDTLHFDCPVNSGEHALRVVLYRADKTVSLQKEKTAELHAGAENNIQVRVNRRAKMLVKHETSLEVIWPGAVAPPIAANNAQLSAAGVLALR